MARIKLPCMSIEAHGQLARGIVFATNQWGQYVKFFVPKKREPTEAQNKVRHAYGEIGVGWRGMTNEEKAPYIAEGRRNRRTGYNQFFIEHWDEIYEP